MGTFRAFLGDVRLNLGVARLWAIDIARRAYLTTPLVFALIFLGVMATAFFGSGALIAALGLPGNSGAAFAASLLFGLGVGILGVLILDAYRSHVTAIYFREREALAREAWEAWRADLAHVRDRYES